MKYTSTLLLIVISISSALSQLSEVRVIGGKNFSTLKFTNSLGQSNPDIRFRSLNTYGINTNFNAERNVFRAELSIREAGAQAIINEQELSWKLNYVDFSLAYLFEAVRIDQYTVAFGAGATSGVLLGGEQLIGMQRYEVNQTDAFERFDLMANGMVNFHTQITKTFSISFEYRFGYSLLDIETQETQQTRNLYHGAFFGVGYTFGSTSRSRI